MAKTEIQKLNQVRSVFIHLGSLQVVDEDVEEGCKDPGETEDGEDGDDVAGEVAGWSQTPGSPRDFLRRQERILGEREDRVVSLVISLLALS